MTRLVARRAAAQWGLLAAVVAVVVVGATLLGVCALLLTVDADRALERGMARAGAGDVDVTAFVTEVAGADAGPVAADARGVLTSALAPFPTTAAARASSVMHQLGDGTGGPRRWAYLSGVDGLPDRARLLAGRWPRPGAVPVEAIVLDGTARRLDLAPGDTVRLGPEVPPDRGGAVTVRVVGVARPLPGVGWDRDPLGAAGYDPAYSDGRYPDPARAYGPFVVDLRDLFAGTTTIDRLQVTAHPDLSAATGPALAAVTASLAGADARLARALGDRVGVERVASQLPATLAVAHAQQAATRSTVLVVVLLGTALAAAALALAGRLVEARRAPEAAVLSVLGAGRAQLAAVAALEALALAVVAALLAVPASALAHAVLTGAGAPARAGLASGFRITGPQVGTVVAGAVLLAAVLVLPALRPDPARAAAPVRGRVGVLARAGADLVLLGPAALAWWQLRVQPDTATGTDTVRVLAPALILLAGAALALRAVGPPLRAAEVLAGRARGLVLPLAALEAVRRPRAVAAGLLVALGTAAATFAPALDATWQRSQHDQADLRVGTDLALTLTAPPVAGDGALVRAATGGRPSPVTDRGVAVGQWLGGAGDPPRLLAVDAARAGPLLRGRLPAGRTWAAVGGRLRAGAAPVAGIGTPAGGWGGGGTGGGGTGGGTAAGPGLTGTAGGAPLLVTPRLVLEDAAGLRTECPGAVPLPLDGRRHALPGCGPAARAARLIAVELEVTVDPAGFATAPTARMDVTVDVPAAGPVGGGPATGGPATGGAGGWSAAAAPDAPVTDPAASLTTVPGGARIRTTAEVGVGPLQGRGVEVVATAFAPPAAVPAVLSRRLADDVDARPGSRLAVTVGATPVPVLVTEVLPALPSVPGSGGLLVDADLLSRRLIASGDLRPPVDAWWVAGPRDDAAARVAALGLGDVVARAQVREQLAAGPLRVGVPTALALLTPAAVLLVLAGTLLHVTSDVDARSVEVARLRGLGLTRRRVLGGLLAQHGGVLALLVAAGTVVGAAAARAVAPPLVRSDLGVAPVPAAVARWPWPVEGVVLAVLLLATTAAVAAVVTVQVRRADAAHLRVGA